MGAMEQFIVRQKPCPEHGWDCVRSPRWFDLYQELTELFFRVVKAPLPARELYFLTLRYTLHQIPWTLECSFDLALWAKEMGCSLSRTRRAAAQLFQAKILYAVIDPAYPDKGKLGWNLNYSDWQALDRDFPPPPTRFTLAVFKQRLEHRLPLLAQAPGPEGGWTALRKFILRLDDYTCQYCGQKSKRLHCDHMIPRSRGGLTIPENLITACDECNQSKRGRTPEEWLA